MFFKCKLKEFQTVEKSQCKKSMSPCLPLTACSAYYTQCVLCLLSGSRVGESQLMKWLQSNWLIVSEGKCRAGREFQPGGFCFHGEFCWGF